MTGRIGVILVGAGESRRMEGIDKVFATLRGRPILDHCLGVMASVPEVAAGVIVVSERNLEQGQYVLMRRGWSVGWSICTGGERRQDSVQRGLERLKDVQWVVIHDVARPCVDRSMVYRALEAVQATGAAVAAVPVTDTVKVVEDGERVVETLDRSRLWAVQTPQVFHRELLETAFAQVQDDVTDEATMVERLGHTVNVFKGDYGNLKVTTPQDLAIAEAILASRATVEVLPSA